MSLILLFYNMLYDYQHSQISLLYSPFLSRGVKIASTLFQFEVPPPNFFPPAMTRYKKLNALIIFLLILIGQMNVIKHLKVTTLTKNQKKTHRQGIEKEDKLSKKGVFSNI